jgi:sucrose-phosphate synthase
MFSIHGLLRAENMELGRDADTGGQIIYVVELAKALGRHKGVRQVDLFTRLIVDDHVSEDYAQPVEKVSEACNIVRIQCGGRKYMRKELLWPHLDEYVDKTIRYIKGQHTIPDVIHGHYPDAGYVATMLSEIFGVPMIYTGHSLGRSKLARLLNEGMKEREIIKKYRIDHRIQMEEAILEKADLVVTSTRQEVEQQYGAYDNKDIPPFKVIPPGLNLEKYYPYYHESLPDVETSETQMHARASVMAELDRFLLKPDKPLILSLCRPDKRKNIAGLIEAYGEDLDLQAMANLAVFAGIRKDINDMEDNERDVLTEILLLMDKYDLYGKIAIPKKHDFEHEVPELYRTAASKYGVFVNSALTEPFGITLIESAACGLPIVAPDDGGPKEIVENCQCGLTVDTTDSSAIAAAVKQLVANGESWRQYSKSGIMNVRNYYTWQSHANTYMDTIKNTHEAFATAEIKPAIPKNGIGRRLAVLDKFIITDLDNTLIGDENSRLEALLELLNKHRRQIGFGVATGRDVESTIRALEEYSIPVPDVIISSSGSELNYFGKHRHPGKGWETHISDYWKREKIVRLLKDLSFLRYRRESAQGPFKISYEMKPAKDRISQIHDALLRSRCRYNLIVAKNRYLDILPYRASKGKAIRYLSYQWDLPLANFLVCGDSGSDEDMLRGEPRAVVVGNYSAELQPLKGLRSIYFAAQNYAGGILEGIDHYQFLSQKS